MSCDASECVNVEDHEQEVGELREQLQEATAKLAKAEAAFKQLARATRTAVSAMNDAGRELADELDSAEREID